MAKNTVFDNVKSFQALDPQDVTSNTDGNILDTQGIVRDLKGVFVVGAVDDGDGDETYTLKIAEDSDSGFGGSPSDVKTKSVDRSSGDNTIVTFEIPQVRTKRERYLRAEVEVGGSSPSILVGAAFEFQKEQSPVGN